ncbi:MAG: zf-HC2 domain-containing protein [Lachnospiraceae bacterium]|nr:zf-HC2 domain-containing protein [Lachnospiraceae bacterium]
MDCREAEKMVQLYIENKIPPKKLEEFIEHISHCPSCYDELETYYTIYFAMKYLDEDRHSSYNIKEMLDEDLKKRIQYVKRHRRKRIITVVALVVLVFWLILCMMFLLMPEIPQEMSDFISNVLQLLGI